MCESELPLDKFQKGLKVEVSLDQFNTFRVHVEQLSILPRNNPYEFDCIVGFHIILSRILQLFPVKAWLVFSPCQWQNTHPNCLTTT